MITVGIVVLNYNKSQYTLQCVQSILDIETFKDFKIVVVDNDSPDLKQKHILEEDLPSSVHLILNKKNGGYAAGNNLGARYAIEELDCRYIFIVNNDCIFEEPILENMICTMQADESIFALSPFVSPERSLGKRMLPITQVRRVLSLKESMICQSMILSRMSFGRKIEHRFLYKDLLPYQQKLYLVDTINGAAFMVKGHNLWKIGYLDERTFLYGEELILGVQIKSERMYCGLNCEVKIFHHQGASTQLSRGKLPYRMFKHELDSFCLLYRKYYNANPTLVGMFKILRYLEFCLKKIYLWLK